MDPNPRMPQRLPDLSDKLRLLLAGMREEEIENFRTLVTMRSEEKDSLVYLAREFSKEELAVIKANLENLRTMKRFGKFGLWLFGFIVAGAGAAGIVKTFLFSGGPK